MVYGPRGRELHLDVNGGGPRVHQQRIHVDIERLRHNGILLNTLTVGGCNGRSQLPASCIEGPMVPVAVVPTERDVVPATHWR